MFLAIGIILILIWVANKADSKVDWSGAIKQRIHKTEEKE